MSSHRRPYQSRGLRNAPSAPRRLAKAFGGNLKRGVSVLFLASALSSFAGEESAGEVAKRVIADKTSAFTPIELPAMGGVSAEVREPGDEELANAAQKSSDVLVAYMLGDSVPEKVRIAYAIGVLASKRIPKSTKYLFGQVDRQKNEGYIKDARILTARLAALEKDECADADQPAGPSESKPESGLKPEPEAAERAR